MENLVPAVFRAHQAGTPSALSGLPVSPATPSHRKEPSYRTAFQRALAGPRNDEPSPSREIPRPTPPQGPTGKYGRSRHCRVCADSANHSKRLRHVDRVRADSPNFSAKTLFALASTKSIAVGLYGERNSVEYTPNTCYGLTSEHATGPRWNTTGATLSWWRVRGLHVTHTS